MVKVLRFTIKVYAEFIRSALYAMKTMCKLFSFEKDGSSEDIKGEFIGYTPHLGHGNQDKGQIKKV